MQKMFCFIVFVNNYTYPFFLGRGHDGWMVPPGYNESGKAYSTVNCGSKPENITHCLHKHCLFDLSIDPCEYQDLSDTFPEILNQMMSRLKFYRGTMVPTRRKPGDKNADPNLHGGAWMPWKAI